MLLQKYFRFIAIFVISLVLSGCDLTQQELEAQNNTMKKAFWLINQQTKYPNQNEYSLNSISEKKNLLVTYQDDGRVSYSLLNEKTNSVLEKGQIFENLPELPLGYVSGHLIKSKQDYLIALRFFGLASNIGNSDESLIKVCYNAINYLNHKNVLYGFNVNNETILRRNNKGDNSPENIENLCKIYVSDRHNVLYLAVFLQK